MSDMLKVKSKRTEHEVQARQYLNEALLKSPLPPEELRDNIGLFADRSMMARWLFLTELYKMNLDVHGVVMEFGVRWGQDMAIFSNLRGLLEPHNLNRKIIGFDTFTGFPCVHEKDGKNDAAKTGAYSVSDKYEETLSEILTANEALSPIGHVKKFELVKGDVTKTLDVYLEQHPETVVSFAYFDLDLYEPTKYALKKILPRMPKGAVIGFDEVNYPQFPGETAAVDEVLGLKNIRLRKFSYAPYASYVVIE